MVGRDVETAIYNAQLYEYEKKEVDWFIEKRYLEEKVAAMDDEVSAHMHKHGLNTR